MSDSLTGQPSDRQARLEQVLADYLHSVENGQPLDRAVLIAAHPDLANDLQSFFRNRDSMDRLAEPLKAAADAPTLLGVSEIGRSPAGMTIRYFGDYELLEEIARGGMGVVYKARQVNLNRIVALKMILAGQLANDSDVKRFYAEAEAAAKLDHPGIVPIFEIGQHEGQHYFSMAFVEGESLAKKVANGPLPPREAAQLVKQVAEAVEYAHQKGIIHRDLKPANVLLDLIGQPRVTDFGLAKQLQGDSGLTGTGQILGTPSYMPPEQAAGKVDQVGPAADVYALGAILYCLLTGRPPFQAANPLDTLRQVLEQEPVPIRQLNAQVPRDLETIAHKCLEKEPSRRCGSAREVASELQRYLNGEPILARPASARERAWKWARRNPALAKLTAAVALLLMALVVGAAAAAIRLAAAARATQGLYLTAQSELVRDKDPGLALVLALEAADLHPGPAANNAVLAALETNRELRTLMGHTSTVTCVAWSNDFKQIVTGSEDMTARLYDAATGKSIATLPHDAPVIAARFTPDSRRLVTLSTRHGQNSSTAGGNYLKHAGEPTARVWDTQSGTLISTWKFPQPAQGPSNWHLNPNAALDISADGSKAVVTFGGIPDRPPCVWDILTGKSAAALQGHTAPVYSVGFSPDGRRIVTASADKTARIWDAASGRQEFILEGHSDSVRFAAFNPAGTRVLTLGRGMSETFAVTPNSNNYSGQSTNEKFVGRLWDAATGKQVAELVWPKAAAGYEQQGCHSVARFSPDGRRIVTAGRESSTGGDDPNHPAVWDAQTGAFVLSLRRPGQRSFSAVSTDAAFSPDGRIVAAAFEDKTIQLWDAHDGKLLVTCQGHEGAVRRVEFSPDGARLVSASDDGTAQIWDTRFGDDDLIRLGLWPDVSTLVFNPACDRVAALKERFDDVLILNANTRRELARTEASAGSRRSDTPFFSADGQTLLLHPYQRPFALYDAATGKRRLELVNPQGPAVAAFSPDGRIVAIATRDEAILWNAADGRELLRLSAWAEHPIYNLMFSPDGGTLLTMNSGPRYSTGTAVPVCLWDLPSGRKRAELRLPKNVGATGSYRASFRPDGRHVVTVIGDRAQIWDTATGHELLVLGSHKGQIHLALYSPGGDRVLTTGGDGQAVLWNAVSGREVWRLKGLENEEIRHAEFTLDGHRLLTASHERIRNGSSYRNGAARLWDAATGAELCTLIRHEAGLRSVTLSPDGRTAIVSFWGPPVLTRTWPVDFLSAARARRPRELTPQERARFELR